MKNLLKKDIASIIFSLLLLFLFFSCAPKFSLNSIEVSSYNMVDSNGIDSAVYTAIQPYKAELEKKMNDVLNVSGTAMVNGSPEGLLGNFVADLILKKANDYYYPADGIKAQMCLLNSGGLRTALPMGIITRGSIFELMPFENEISVVTVSGKKMQEIFKYLAQSGGAPVSGLKMGIQNGNAVNVFVDGHKYDSTMAYKIVTSDYLANGGDRYGFFSAPLKCENLGVKLRDAIIEYCIDEKQKGNALNSKLDERIFYVR